MRKITKVKLALLFLISLVVIKYISLLELSGFWKLVLSLVYLYITSLYVRKEIPGAKEELFPGLLMIRTKKWLEELRRLLPLGLFLETLAKVVFFALFGMLGIVLAKWMDKRMRILYWISGMFLLYVLMLAYPFAFLKLDVKGNAAEANVMMLMLLVGSGLFGLFSYSFGSAVWKTFLSLISQEQVPTTITPLLPGINLPFFEGIIALGLALVIHELSHAILSLRYNIPLKSTGLLTYGILPVGAFVEPDEQAYERTEPEKKLNILLAGPASNLFLGVVFFGVFLLYLIFTTPFATEGCYVVRGAEPGTIITTIDNVPCIYAIAQPGDRMLTNKGEMEWNESIYYYPIGKESMVRYYENEILNFFYNLIYMLFSLNLLLGFANLFPIMFFDGGQIVREVGRAWNQEKLAMGIVVVFTAMLLFLIGAGLL